MENPSSVVTRPLFQRGDASLVANFSQLWWGRLIGLGLMSIGEYNTTRDPPPCRVARPARAQRGRSGALSGRPCAAIMEESMGGKGGRHISSLALASGGRKCQWSIISNLQTAASAGRPERRNTGQAKTAQLQSCHGKIGSSPKIPPKIIVLKNAILFFCIKGIPVGRKALLRTLENSTHGFRGRK